MSLGRMEVTEKRKLHAQIIEANEIPTQGHDRRIRIMVFDIHELRTMGFDTREEEDGAMTMPSGDGP